MKKNTLILSTTLMILASGLIMGQESEKEKRKVGTFRIGWQASCILDQDGKLSDGNSLSSFYVGFARDTKIVPLLWFGSGIEYFQNGSHYSPLPVRKLHTLSVPVDLKLKLGPVYGLAGIAANFKLAEKLQIDGEWVNPLEADKTYWFDAPVFVGLGIKIIFLSIEARYHWGTVDARGGRYNRYFQVGAGFTF